MEPPAEPAEPAVVADVDGMPVVRKNICNIHIDIFYTCIFRFIHTFLGRINFCPCVFKGQYINL